MFGNGIVRCDIVQTICLMASFNLHSGGVAVLIVGLKKWTCIDMSVA